MKLIQFTGPTGKHNINTTHDTFVSRLNNHSKILLKISHHVVVCSQSSLEGFNAKRKSRRT